jgi:uncharacterized protein YqhQ
MNRLRIRLRTLLALQLLPALESASEEALIGGQAVLEGVMMRSPHAWGIAVRKHTGEIAAHCEPLDRPSEKHRWLAWPFIRGLVTLGQAMSLGFRALRFSADVMLEGENAKAGNASPKKADAEGSGKSKDSTELSGWVVAVNSIISIGFFIVMYKLVPLMGATALTRTWSTVNNHVLFNLVDGVIRLSLFLLFIWGISLFSDIHRVYEYHGAEHKTVFAYEAKREIPSIEFTQKFSTYHPRCGTSFLMTVMLFSILVYMAFPITAGGPRTVAPWAVGHWYAIFSRLGILDRVFWYRLGLRVLLLAPIASVSYEMIRFSAKHGRSLFAVLTRPGLWMQRITTKQPKDDQVECAIKALDEAMALEKARGGELVIA